MTQKIPFVEVVEDMKTLVSYKRFNGIISPSSRGYGSLRQGAIRGGVKK
jgi:hypothetical protein